VRCRICTWNIHRGIGSDGIEDLDRIGTVLGEIAPAVIALQEVGYQSRSSVAVAERLADTIDAQLVAGVTLTDHAGDYGNAILTRLPVTCIKRHDLSVEGREPRGLLEVSVTAGDHSLRLLATHLGLKASERRQQFDQIREIAGQSEGTTDLLLGDFNEWRPYAGTLRQMTRLFGRQSASPATFPAARPVLALDRIVARPATAIGNLSAHRTPLARTASDHLPLIADLQLTRCDTPSGSG
jgi:endonuclease/exonuclease/phosphatase family metal-dependent hydrolase